MLLLAVILTNHVIFHIIYIHISFIMYQSKIKKYIKKMLIILYQPNLQWMLTLFTPQPLYYIIKAVGWGIVITRGGRSGGRADGLAVGRAGGRSEIQLN